MTLQEFFTQHHKAALAFSGGVDSAYLLWAAYKYGAQVQPYFVRTCFQPLHELQDARRLCQELQVPLRILDVDILQERDIQSNPPRRCYYCKKRMFLTIWRTAQADGYDLLLDGTNADDDAQDRPGMQVLQELPVCSPLRACKLTKAAIREASRQAGLFTWDKPAYACLATRIPTGTAITAADLGRAERAENTLMELGFSDLRVRLRGDTALVQLPAAQMPGLLEQREAVLRHLQKDFKHITLDLEART